MIIGVDLCNLDSEFAGGVNTFAFGLIRGLLDTLENNDRLVLLLTNSNEAFLRAMFPDSNVSFLNIPINRWNARLDSILFKVSWVTGNFRLRYWYDRIFRAKLMHKIDRAVDVVIAPLTLLRWYGMRAPALLCIHDIQQEYLPDFFSWKDLVRRWTPYRLSAWRAEAIQASSRYVKDCLLGKFSFVTSDKIFVIPEGVDRERFSTEAPSEKPPDLANMASGDFVFYPAQLWAHKNHLMLIDALALYRDTVGAEFPCVLTGRDYGHWPALQAKIKAHGLEQIYFLGQVCFPQLLWVYQNCTAVLALGLHESSSLPLREGATFGKVLMCLDIPPNREAQESFHVQLVDRTDPRSLLAALIALSENRDQMVGISRENAEFAKRFEWKDLAREYRQILDKLTVT